LKSEKIWTAAAAEEEEEEITLGVIMTNTDIKFHIFHIFSLFNLLFIHIFHIFTKNMEETQVE
jgi:hypothetical protein